MQGRVMLLATVLAAVVVTVATTVALLLLEPAAPRSEAIRTGAVGGGAVIALYALWLNDRRRRLEEARHDLEGEKIADERFARSVEMPGDEADQVRVGAMHSLAGLAGSTPRYKQTVLDVLCAYLRRPFVHPELHDEVDTAAAPESDPEADREREVRFTAQRLIADLLPWGEDPDPRNYHLDLTGARLDHFRLEGRRIGRVTARKAYFHGITRLARMQAATPALFADAAFLGRLDLREARFLGGASFRRARFGDEVVLEGATVDTFLDIGTAAPAAQVGTLVTGAGTRIDGTADGWALAAGSP